MLGEYRSFYASMSALLYWYLVVVVVSNSNVLVVEFNLFIFVVGGAFQKGVANSIFLPV